MGKCKKCGKFVSKNSTFRYEKDDYCEDCAVKIIVSAHQITEEEANQILTRQQVGNGFRW